MISRLGHGAQSPERDVTEQAYRPTAILLPRSPYPTFLALDIKGSDNGFAKQPVFWASVAGSGRVCIQVLPLLFIYYNFRQVT
jgi:hypothetical protein